MSHLPSVSAAANGARRAPGTVPLRLFILGATGGTGRALVDQSRERGHVVTAFVRSPQRLGAPRDGVIVLFDDAGILFAVLRRILLRNVAEDSVQMERVVMASGLDWTIARPPKLTNGPLTENYHIENGRMPRGRISISRADVAHFLLGELEGDGHVGQIVGMAGT